jgi:hypothetical protein
MGHEGTLDNGYWMSLVNWDFATVEWQPRLEVTYPDPYSDNSNMVAACTLAALPVMDNNTVTFTSTTSDTITVEVSRASNSAGTVIELFFAPDVGGGPGSWASKGTNNTDYTWGVGGLSADTSYWFKARAQNWASIWTDYCDVTSWKTSPPPPSNFGCTDCSSTTLTWTWNEVTGEDGYDIFDNETNTVVVANIGAGVTSTVETGLSPNATYRRYIKAYLLGSAQYENCGSTNSGHIIGTTKYDSDVLTQYYGSSLDEYRGYCKFGLDNLSEGVTVTGVKLYAYCYNAGPAIAEFDIRKLASDPDTASGATIVSEITSGTVFIDNSTANRSIDYKVFSFESASHSWVESCISQGWCAIGTKEEYYTSDTDGSFFSAWNDANQTYRPVLEVTYKERVYSGPSNVVETCTAAAVPFMDSIPSTFTFENRDTITARVGLNGNPPGTTVELFYASDAGGSPGPYTSLGTRNSGYKWNVSGLSAEMPYWFKSRAQNWAGILTDNCADTAWSTDGDYTQTLPFKGYHMLNLPCNHGGKTFAELFGDAIGGALWIYCWEETTNSWQFVNANSVPQDNCGYIIWAYQANTVLGMNGESLDCTGNITINVTCSGDNEVAYWGYNLIRNPFTSEVAWSSCDLQNCEATHWRPWNGNQYEWYMNPGSKSTNGSDTIPGGAGFWVHAIGENAYVKIYDPGEAAPKPLPPPALQWRMQISAFTGSYMDTYTYAGVRGDALEAYDTYDVVEIRSVNQEYIKAYFDHPEWGRFRGPYTQDTRPFPAVGGTLTWALTVYATNAAGSVDMTLHIPEEIRTHWRFCLRDEFSGSIRDLSLDADYSYAASGEDTRNFTLTATRLQAYKLGDSNLDGTTDDTDALFCARVEHGLEIPTSTQKYVSDLSSDGKVDTLDALLLLRRLRGYLKDN